MITAWKKFRFISSEKSNFHVIDNLSIAVLAITKCMLSSHTHTRAGLSCRATLILLTCKSIQIFEVLNKKHFYLTFRKIHTNALSYSIKHIQKKNAIYLSILNFVSEQI